MPSLNDLMTSWLSISITVDLIPNFYSRRTVNLGLTCLNVNQTAIKCKIRNIFRYIQGMH